MFRLLAEHLADIDAYGSVFAINRHHAFVLGFHLSSPLFFEKESDDGGRRILILNDV